MLPFEDYFHLSFRIGTILVATTRPSYAQCVLLELGGGQLFKCQNQGKIPEMELVRSWGTPGEKGLFPGRSKFLLGVRVQGLSRKNELCWLIGISGCA